MSRAARVVPRLATFAVDRGFWYSVPSSSTEDIGLGSIVRVPLSGRTVRGYVVELADSREGDLKEILAVSGASPVFGERLLGSLSWAANHYVAPLSVLLDRSAPPNLPGEPGLASAVAVRPSQGDHPLGALAVEAAAGKRRPPMAFVQGSHDEAWLEGLSPVLESGKSVMVIVATVAESNSLANRARMLHGDRVFEASGEVARKVTEAWNRMQVPGHVLIGTPRIAAWQVSGLALCVVIEEGRRAMKDRQTPTIHVRDLMIQRSRLEGFSLAFVGPTPSVELIAAGAEVVRVGKRAWPLIEIVDRSEEAPGSGFLSERAIQALRAMVNRRERSLVFTHRRRADASMRCTRCRTVRACSVCGSRLGREERCRRCGEPADSCTRCGSDSFEEMGTVPEMLATTINRRLGAELAAAAPTDGPIVVGTERDLTGLSDLGLVVIADADGLVLGHDYRAGEEGLRILARVGNTLGPGSGHRMMVQTSIPESPLIAALRGGNPMPYLEGQLAQRARDGLPPSTSMMAVEIAGDYSASKVTQELSGLGDVAVLGPATVDRGHRWLLQGSLGKPKVALRKLVQTWRDAGATVRLDADPIDL